MDKPADTESTDSNAAIWKSDDAVRAWLRDVDQRERERLSEWQLMGHLLPFHDADTFTFLDLGAGTGAASRVILDLYPHSTAILADYSQQMMAEAGQVMRRYGDRFTYVEFDMLVGAWPGAIPATVDAVITSQCVHHLPDQRKQGLFQEIFERLVPGGWYLNFDPVSTDDTGVETAWQRANDRLDPAAAHKRLHRTPEEEARHANHIRYIIPLAPQLRFLQEAGFGAVDVYWKRLDYVIYGGRRPKRA